MKTGNDFRESAIKNSIDFWGIHECTICHYSCGYLFFDYEDAEVVYDSGCDCTGRYYKTGRTWDDVAAQYNLTIKNEHIIKEYDEFWHFE